MLSISFPSATQFKLAELYSRNQKSLSDSLLRLVSGKKQLSASDDIGTYLRAQKLQSQYESFKPVKENLSNWRDTLESARDTADAVDDMLDRMKELANLSNQTTDNELKSAYNTEFHQIAHDIQDTINNTTFSDYSMMLGGAPLATLNLDPTGANQLDLNIPEAIDETNHSHITALLNANIGPASGGGNTGHALADVENALTDLARYQGTVSGYVYSVKAHINIAGSIMENSRSAQSDLTDTNNLEEMMNYTSIDIKQQTLLALLAQANMSQQNMLALYSGMGGFSGL